MVEEVAVPLDVRLRFGRAAVQVVADRIGARVLHIKGDAVDASLRPMRTGSDVDILVHPSDVARLDAAVRAEGWVLYSTFANGSPFGHAQTYLHETWAYLDLHRAFPGIGIGPEDAFGVLGRGGTVVNEVGVECRAPGLDAQLLLLLLNAARDSREERAEAKRMWEAATPGDRERVLRLADELRARVALAAAIGDLEEYRGSREYTLWRAITEGGSRGAEWWGRIRAASSLGEALALVARAPRVNMDRLRHDLGHEPSRAEVFREFAHRQSRAVREAVGWVRKRRP